jgi:alkanesulfonate monooxygenase SsuD/methylene tetrahydromethanopterin reductase-like flavin-dependent oxidoreductase (luciferase family)
MRTTLCLDPRRPWPDLRKLARQAEAAGWDAVRIGDADGPGGLDCLTVFGALAASVDRIRFEAVVAAGRGRHPAVVAKLAATVDQLSAGRLLLGMAPAADADAVPGPDADADAGPEADPDAAAGPDARARLAEAFTVLRCLTTQPHTTWAGQWYRLEEAPLDPKPRQQPFPLMLVGGDSDLAALIADHWSIEGDVEAQLAALQTSCAKAGRDRATITVAAPYPAAGVDEWVVPDAALGDSDEERTAALSRLVTQAESR